MRSPEVLLSGFLVWYTFPTKNTMDILEKIFGSAAKVKIMRLFLFNPNTPFDLDKITARAKITPQAARLNIRLLDQARMIRSRGFVKEERRVGKNGKKVTVKKRVKGWSLDDSFPYLDQLQRFLVQTSPLQDQAIVRKFNRAGKVKLLVAAGVFIQDRDSRVDLLIVGDTLRKSTIDSAIKDIEAELGKDLSYSVFETKDFNYRLGMYDKLIRDILDYPHKKLVNRLGV